jgi:hypothetical protein
VEFKVRYSSSTLEGAKEYAENFFNCELRILREELSLFEQYHVRPVEHKFIKEIWKYRIIAKNDEFHFGTI